MSIAGVELVLDLWVHEPTNIIRDASSNNSSSHSNHIFDATNLPTRESRRRRSAVRLERKPWLPLQSTVNSYTAAYRDVAEYNLPLEILWPVRNKINMVPPPAMSLTKVGHTLSCQIRDSVLPDLLSPPTPTVKPLCICTCDFSTAHEVNLLVSGCSVDSLILARLQDSGLPLPVVQQVQSLRGARCQMLIKVSGLCSKSGCIILECRSSDGVLSHSVPVLLVDSREMCSELRCLEDDAHCSWLSSGLRDLGKWLNFSSLGTAINRTQLQTSSALQEEEENDLQLRLTEARELSNASTSSISLKQQLQRSVSQMGSRLQLDLYLNPT
jgi:hypothetical protein